MILYDHSWSYLITYLVLLLLRLLGMIGPLLRPPLCRIRLLLPLHPLLIRLTVLPLHGSRLEATGQYVI